MDINELLEAPPSVLDALSPEILFGMKTAADEHMSAASKMQAILHETMKRRYANHIVGHGTSRFADGNFEVTIAVPKRVKWDQEKLRNIAGVLIGEWGETPSDYIDEELSVSESKFKAWPPKIVALFEPARTVEAGKPVIKLAPAKAEAA